MLTPEQFAIVEAIKSRSSSVAINASAGSGKTFTLVESAKTLPIHKKNIAIAFGKDIKTELEKRLPSHVSARTFHSLGYAIIMRNRPNAKSDMRKLNQFIYPIKMDWELKQHINRAVGMAKNLGYGIDKSISMENVIEACDLVPNSVFTNACEEVFQKSLADVDKFDFDDMVYLPALWFSQGKTWPNFYFDNILIDESQDTSVINQIMIQSISCPTTKTFWFGDPHQAIYGWRGADLNAFESLIKTFDCSTLPMSICFRCSKAVIRLAQTIVPQIQHTPDAVEGSTGSFKTLDELKAVIKTNPTEDFAILCRNNRPLIALACTTLIPNGIRFKYANTEYIDAVRKVDKDTEGPTIEARKAKVQDLINSTVPKLKTKLARAKFLEKLSCLELLLQYQVRSGGKVDTIEPTLSLYFDSDFTKRIPASQQQLTLSTIHKAKGLEWTNVCLIQPSLLNPNVQSDDEPTDFDPGQCKNLHYVAITRAKVNYRELELPK